MKLILLLFTVYLSLDASIFDFENATGIEQTVDDVTVVVSTTTNGQVGKYIDDESDRYDLYGYFFGVTRVYSPSSTPVLRLSFSHTISISSLRVASELSTSQGVKISSGTNSETFDLSYDKKRGITAIINYENIDFLDVSLTNANADNVYVDNIIFTKSENNLTSNNPALILYLLD